MDIYWVPEGLINPSAPLAQAAYGTAALLSCLAEPAPSPCSEDCHRALLPTSLCAFCCYLGKQQPKQTHTYTQRE